ncbi:MAG: glutamate-5-semialdehyde dehydrogenase [Lachnospiraceae bacterium]|nr:glutamate-5-semialdehyde dehydrogenase [Lachnospiraceae bacterium]
MFDLESLGQNAVQASYGLARLSEQEKNKVLLHVADALVAQSKMILQGNEKDILAAKENGIREAMIDRLSLTKERIEGMAEGIRQIAALPDPVGEVLETFERPNGLQISKVRVPLGVVGIIYESRPNVTADAFGLCFKAGNAVILKGGKEAIHTNIAIVDVIRQAIRDMEKEFRLDEHVIGLITDTSREVTNAFMKLKQYVDVLIPRGGAGLISAVVENSTIPVIETGTGNCHIYVDEYADMEKAVPIIVNAKTQRVSVCNTCESLVVHEAVAEKFLPLLQKAMAEKKVELRGDADCLRILPDLTEATEEDFMTEYLDYILSMKTVSSVEEAIEHINRCSTKHSEAIITESEEHANQFLQGISSACVYVNASTRFTDGFEFGFGAEIGISNQKLHARGPMGLREMTTYQYRIKGNGQIRC